MFTFGSKLIFLLSLLIMCESCFSQKSSSEKFTILIGGGLGIHVGFRIILTA